MSDPIIRVKRSTVQGKVPTTDQLGLGEIAINHYDGKLFIRQDTLGVGIGTTVIQIGVQGIQGIQGNTGAQGTQGTSVQGVQGIQGLEGSQGATGTQGTQGIQGTQGVQGVQGLEGSQGIQGIQGIQGLEGSQGTTGTQGTDGVQGTQGVQGVQGTQGTQGIQGIQGTSGSFGGAAFDYTFDTGTADSDPGQGRLRFNQTTINTANYLFIHQDDDNLVDITSFLQTIDDSTSAIKGHFTIAEKGNSTNFTLCSIVGLHTEYTNYFAVPVSYLSGVSTSFSNNLDIIITFARTGDIGDTGAQGIQGTTGIQGFTGIQGTQGIQGIQGTQGIQGVQGTDGIQGIQGIQGTQGIQGVQGTDGIQGFVGTQGIQGIQGTQGIQGVQGTDGIQGFTGIQGATGSGAQGIQGIQGTDGIQGALGTQGTQGIQGVQGSSFARQESNFIATPGQTTFIVNYVVGYIDVYLNGVRLSDDEYTATNGTSIILNVGASNGDVIDVITFESAGPQGTQGIQGIQGPQGIQGIQGPQGTQGIQGIQGIQGPQGIQGIQGPQGTQGIQGIQGIQGTVGTTGGVPYIFSSTTTDSDPGNGTIRYNNSTIGAVSFIYIDNNDSNSDAQTTWYDTWDDSTNPGQEGYLLIQSGTTTVNVWSITGAVTAATGYYKIPVAHISGSLPVDGSLLAVQFSRTGNQGTQGVQGITGIQGSTGTAGAQGTTGTAGVQGTTGTAGAQGATGATWAVNDSWRTTPDGRNRFYFTSNGRTYFGSADGYEWRSSTDGNIGSLTNAGTLTVSGDVNSNSDLKLKKNIKTITNALEKILQLRGVEFDRIDLEGKHQIGFIAQEIENILPELVGELNGIKSVSYGNITAVLVEAIKEQQEQINSLREEINSLKQ